MERIILISDRATEAERDSVAVHIDPSEYMTSVEPNDETLKRLVVTATRMNPDRIIIDTSDASILAIPKQFGIPSEDLYTFRKKRLWKVASQVLDGEYIYQCYQRRYVQDVDCAGDRKYDTEIFTDREKAAARCRELNSHLLPHTEGWMTDRHPQNG